MSRGTPWTMLVAPISSSAAIDEMPLGTEFEIGSDVPADVNCSLEPAHPDCA